VDKLAKYIIVKFLKFVSNELNLNKPFKVKLAQNRDEDLKTYAYYNATNGDIKVYCKNRGVADVLRSIAHELIHHQQNQTGKILLLQSCVLINFAQLNSNGLVFRVKLKNIFKV
jgi:hypothetical protein